MRAADTVKLRWLIGVMDQLSNTDFDLVSGLLDKQYKSWDLLTKEDLVNLDSVFNRVREQVQEQRMVG